MYKRRFGGLSNNEIRVLIRDYRSMIKEFSAVTEVFPEAEDPRNPGCWHVRLPAAASFLNSSKTPASIRRLCIQALIDRAQYLIDMRPKSKKGARVIAEIDLPRLSDSGIIVFFDASYFDGLFNQDSKDQEWMPLSNCRSLEKEWVLSIPDKLSLTGYQEEISDEGHLYTREFWFVGELD